MAEEILPDQEFFGLAQHRFHGGDYGSATAATAAATTTTTAEVEDSHLANDLHLVGGPELDGHTATGDGKPERGQVTVLHEAGCSRE